MTDFLELTVGSGPENTLDAPGISALRARVETAIAAHDPILLTGTNEGRFFCGGFDLNAVRATDAATQRQAFEDFLHLGRLLFTAPVPVVVRAGGHAIGIGATLVLAADHSSIPGRAKLRFPETLLGIGVFADMAAMIRHRNGTGLLAERMLSRAVALTGEEAVRAGLADAIAPSTPDESGLSVQDIIIGPSSAAWAQAKATARHAVLSVPIADQLDSFMPFWDAAKLPEKA